MTAPPPDAVSLYRGRIMHARLGAIPHRFAYRLFWILVDLDRLEEADRAALPFSVNRGNLVSFHERDHGPRDGSGLRAHAERLLAEAGVAVPGGRMLLLCLPRVLGYAFNPLSITFAYRPDGTLAAMLHEVRNTFGERHTYVEAVLSSSGPAHRIPKAFRVSPFLGMDLAYRFTVRPPGEEVGIRILVERAGAPVLSTASRARRLPLTTGTVLRAFLALPLMTFKVTAGIHWEALRLWIKGVRTVGPVRPVAGDRLPGDSVAPGTGPVPCGGEAA
jgi:DUF1365 family protein